ncbi:MAG: helix-turn-helix domain-containing protein, partial [Actinobacteria bacterium]
MAEPVRARRLTDDEGRRLQQIVRRGKHGTIRVRRALIVMASASGTPVPAIARLVAAHEDTVRDVIHSFNEIGLRAISLQRTRTWKESTDPNKETKLDRIEEVTTRVPDRCFAFDQFGPLAIRPHHGTCWAPKTRPDRLP